MGTPSYQSNFVMNSPKNDSPGNLIANLTAEQQRELLAELLRKRAAQQEAAVAKEFAMSAGQQGLWYAFCRDPHATSFNVFLSTRIRSTLDLASLQKSIELLAERHACLRTTFSDSGGELRQIVHSGLKPEFKVVDAAHLRTDEKELQRAIVAESQRAFNLTEGPLLRLAVFQLTSTDTIVLATTHHIVVDFWSLILILAELRQVYPTYAKSEIPRLAPATNNYETFVTEQHATLNGATGERLRAYWQTQLQGAPTHLELVTDFQRPQAFTGRAHVQPINLPQSVSERIFDLAAQTRTTPFTIVQAAIQVLLCKYTGQRDFLIGSPFSGRSHRKFESTVGFFVNMLPLRANLQGDPSFIEVIDRANQTLLGALEHEGYPFSAIVRDLNPPRDASRSPLFQVSCTFEKAQLRSEAGRAGFLFPGEKESATIGGLQQESFYVPHQTCHYDLEFIFEQTERNLRGMICYCRDLFSSDSMAAMSENYINVLDALLGQPRKSVFAVQIAASDKIVKSAGSSASPPDHDTVCSMIERTAAIHREQIAMVADARQLTYGDLIANLRLRSQKLVETNSGRSTAQQLISVNGPNSPDTMISILAVMFAGEAVIPIDSDQPAISSEDLVRDTRANSVIDTSHERPIPTSANSAPMVSPGDLAYVIYTSGSTGRPKGVMIEHQAICNTLRWRHRSVPIQPGDRVLALLSHQFDAGLGIALATLTQGGALVWPDKAVRNDINALVEQLIRDRITILPGIPSLLRLIVEHPRFSECRDLRMLWSGGEAMPREFPELVRNRTSASLWNFYGPTETAVEAIATQVQAHDERFTVPLGSPITGVDVWVVDENLRVLADTMPGQLAITGKGLARGYLNLPELTAERFIQLSLQDGNTVRAYLTGDRCRKLRSGQFEYLGRIDNQVKLRGYRIELQEIEQQLLAHPLVSQAVVILSEADSVSAQLLGYICLREASGNSEEIAALIRRDLSTKLAAYKIPAHLFVLDQLPTTSSGKVDRQRLPRLVPRTSKFVTLAPTTPLEEYLAAAWCDALKLNEVGINQNFFELGGSSLQAAILTAKLTGDLGVHIPTSLLFDLADIAQIARRLVQLYEVSIAERFGMNSVTAYTACKDRAHASDAKLDSGTLHPLIAPLKPSGSRNPIFMIHPPGGIVLCYRELAARVTSQQPLYAIRSRGLHGQELLPTSIEQAAEDYIDAMRSVQPTGPFRLGGWSLGGLFALEMASQLLQQGLTVEQLLLLDTAIPESAANLVPSRELLSAGREYGIDLSLNELNALHPDEQLPLLWQHAQSLGLLQEETPPEVITQVLQDLKSLFHHHLELATRYQVRRYPGEITLIRPTEVPFDLNFSPDRGWRFIAESVQVRHVAGHHHSMVQMPYVIELAAAIETR